MDTKEQILEAGLKLMNKFGYASLSLSELALATKTSRQSVYYHFKSTDDVLILLAEEWSRTGQHYAVEALSSTHEVGAFKLLAISDGMFHWMHSKSELSRLGVVLFQSAPHIKELDRFMTSARHSARERIKSILVQDVAFAKMTKKKLEEVITSFHSLMYGFFFYVVAMNDFSHLEKHHENCNQAIRRLIASYK